MHNSQRRQLAAIMFTDMEGYTALLAQDEDLARRLRARHREVLKDSHLTYEGKILQYFGDGTLSLFNSAVQAVQCAIFIQRILQQEPIVPLRIGIHFGEVVWDKDDIYGHAVNVASRLESFAPAGSIIVSSQVHNELNNHNEFKFQAMGMFDLKNVPNAMELYAIVNDGIVCPKVNELKGKGSLKSNTHKDPDKSIAVLPFVNMSNDPEQEYLSIGLSEELINALVKIRGLKVAGRTSSFFFKDKNEDLRNIGQILGVSTILEGSIRKSGSRLRITAQLINVEDGFHLWSETYNRELADIFEIQDQITEAITNELRVRLVESLSPRQNPKAFDAYLKGRYYNYLSQFDAAEKYFHKALEIDPNYALPYIGLGDINGQRGVMGFISPNEAYSMGKHVTIKGTELDPSSAEGHEILARWKFFYDWDWSETEFESKTALGLNPDNPDAGFAYTWLLMVKRKFSQAEEQANRLLSLDKMNPAYQATPGWLFLFDGEIDKSISIFKKLPPAFPWASYGLWIAYHKTGELSKAIEAAIQYFTVVGQPEAAKVIKEAEDNITYEKIMRNTAKSLSSYLDQKYVPRIEIARLYAHAKDYDLAIIWLEKAVANNEPYSVILFLDLDWYEMRESPRFKKLLKKLNLN